MKIPYRKTKHLKTEAIEVTVDLSEDGHQKELFFKEVARLVSKKAVINLNDSA